MLYHVKLNTMILLTNAKMNLSQVFILIPSSLSFESRKTDTAQPCIIQVACINMKTLLSLDEQSGKRRLCQQVHKNLDEC